MAKELRNTLQSKPMLGFLILLILAIFSISLYLFFSFEKETLIEKTYIELETINHYKTNLINLWLEERKSDVSFISNIHLMHDEFEQLQKQPNNKKLIKKICSHYSTLKMAYYYENIIIYSKDGNFILSTDNENLQISNETIHKIKNYDINSSFVSNCYLVNDTTTNFDIVFPMNYSSKEDRNEIVFIVLKVNPLKHLGKTIYKWPVKTKTAETVLYEKNADTIYNVIPINEIISKPMQLKVTTKQKEVLIVNSINSHTGIQEGIDYKQEAVFGFVSKIDGLNWYLVTKINKDEVFEEYKFRMNITIIVIIVLFFALVYILFAIRKNEKNSIYLDLYKNELELRQNNEIFKTTLYSIGDGVIATDANGIITQMNPIAEQLTGWHETNALGQRLENVYRIQNEVTGEELVSPVNKVLRTGEIFLLSNSTMLISKNGSKTPIANSGAPIRDSSGNLIGVVLVIRDYTKEFHARNILIESELYANNILNKLNDSQEIANIGSWEIDLVTDEVWWSEQMYNIFEEDRNTFKPDVSSSEKYVKPEQLISNRDVVNNAIRDHIEFEFIDEIVTAKGNIRYCRAVGKALYNSHDLPIKLIVSVLDITQIFQTNKALIDNISNYKNLVESSQEAILVHRNRKIIFANDSCLQLLGIEESNDLIGQEISTIIHPESLPKVLKRISDIESGKNTYLITVKLLKKDNTLIHAEVSCSKYEDSEGVAFQVVIRDITQKVASEKQLRQLGAAVVQSPASIVITDVFGRIEFVNPKFEETTGYTKDEVLKNNPRILKSGNKTKEEYAELWETISSGKVWSGEFLNVKKNKEEFWESATIAPIFDEKGEIVNYIGVKLDITEKKKIEEKIIQDEAKFRTYIENAPVGVVITNKMGNILDINSEGARLIESSPDEIISNNIANFIEPQKIEEVFNLHSKLAIGDSYSIELKIFKKDNNNIWVLFQTARLSEDLFLSYALNIDDIKRFEKDLILAKDNAEEMNRLKSSFLSNMSHELRTPMIGILGFAQLLEQEEDIAEIKDMSHLIYDSGKRLMDTLNSILNLSKIESGDVKLQIDKFNLIDYLDEIIQVYVAQVKEKNIVLHFANNDKELYINTDKHILYDILTNLINNAVKFTQNGGVTITENVIESDGIKYIKIEVIDTGIGIAKDKIEFIFDEFRQGSEGIARQYEGSGLGLTISKKFAQLLGGDLSVISKVDSGSTFTLLFPLVQEKSVRLPKVINQLSEPLSKSNDKKELLYVEDDDISIAYLKRLCPKNYAVHTTRNSKEAMEILSKNEIDIIFMDINLGADESGLDIIKMIKATPNLTHIPIVACTAFAMMGDEENFLSKGCNDYMSKPFNKATFLDKLNKWVKN